MIALIIGTVLAVGALAFVLYPIFFGVKRHVPQATVAPANEGESAVAALREIEFDRATGKLSDADYADLKARYTKEAVAAMRRAIGGAGRKGMRQRCGSALYRRCSCGAAPARR